MLGKRHSLMHDLLSPDTAFVFFTSYLLYLSSPVFPLDTSLFRTLLPDDSGQHVCGYLWGTQKKAYCLELE